MTYRPNPYASPQSMAGRRAEWTAERIEARRQVRLALAILLAPGIYNFAAFDMAVRGDRQSALLEAARILNTTGVLLLCLFIWFCGLQTLEVAVRVIHRVVGRRDTVGQWLAALYAALARLWCFAAVGALLWFAWVAGFYYLHIGFYRISYPVGILAHLLAAGLYLPLIWRWYRLERRVSAD